MTNYEFLARLHAVTQPRGYLEIGVRHGDSIRLASCPAIGIDPVPSASAPSSADFSYAASTSDDFFDHHQAKQYLEWWGHPIDLAYIDGMHLVENATRDFINIERYSNERTVVVFDDVLPYSHAIAAREQPAGDWTGDVWKVIPILKTFRLDLEWRLVDVAPTGALVVAGLDPIGAGHRYLNDFFHYIVEPMISTETVPDYILDRRDAISPDECVEWLLSR